jgi:hypothetical protein
MKYTAHLNAQSHTKSGGSSMKMKCRYERVEEGVFVVAAGLGFIAMLHIVVEMIAWII